jgi:hypothetical protein
MFQHKWPSTCAQVVLKESVVRLSCSHYTEENRKSKHKPKLHTDGSVEREVRPNSAKDAAVCTLGSET